MLDLRIQQHFIDSADLQYQAAETLAKPLDAGVQALMACVTSGGKVLVCGEGSSAALALYFASLFVGGFERERPQLGDRGNALLLHHVLHHHGGVLLGPEQAEVLLVGGRGLQVERLVFLLLRLHVHERDVVVIAEERHHLLGFELLRSDGGALHCSPSENTELFAATIGGLGLTGLIVTKLDGTAKGGVLAAIAQERPIPVYFIGVGEKLEDLQTFNAREFAQALLS